MAQYDQVRPLALPRTAKAVNALQGLVSIGMSLDMYENTFTLLNSSFLTLKFRKCLSCGHGFYRVPPRPSNPACLYSSIVMLLWYSAAPFPEVCHKIMQQFEKQWVLFCFFEECRNSFGSGLKFRCRLGDGCAEYDIGPNSRQVTFHP